MRFTRWVPAALPPGWRGIVAFCLVLIAAIWVLTTHRIGLERTQAIEAARQQNQNLALAFEEHIIRTLRGVDQILLWVKHAVEHRMPAREITHLLQQASEDPTLNVLIGVIDEEGRLRHGTIKEAEGKDFSFMSHFKAQQRADAGLHVGPPLLGRFSRVDVIPFTRRLDHEDGRFAGIVTAGVRRDYFRGFYSKSDLGDGALVAYIGDDGIVRASNAEMSEDFTHPAYDARVFSKTGQSWGTYISRSDRDGIERILSFRRLSQYSGVVVVGTSVTQALEPVAQRSWWYYHAAVAGSAFILMFMVGHLALAARHHRSVLALRQKEEVLEESQRMAQIGSWKLELSDPDQNKMQFTNEMYRLFGYDPGEIECTRDALMSLVHAEDRAAVQTALELAIGQSGKQVVEHRIVRRDGEIRHMVTKARTMRDRDFGKSTVLVATMRDITEQKVLERQLLHQARIDALTEMPNRNVFAEALEGAIVEAERGKRRFAVLFVDLDRFKAVNDSLGHDVGDRLLIEVGRRFSACMRRDDVIARLGGDEFGVIVGDIAARTDADAVAAKMTAALGRHFVLSEHEMVVTASVGIALYPEDGQDARTLMKNADVAMYRAKERGPNTHQFYTEEMNRAALERVVMIGRLKHAAERDQFELRYQPVIDARTATATSCEALLRWREGGQDIASPADFVPLLESSGLVLRAGEWVIENACKQLSSWRAAGFPMIPVAVNLSARQFEHAGLLDVLEGALARYELPPGLLQVEITEGAAMRNAEETVAVLQKISELGVGLKIDDFGTGYSSLAYLKRFSIHSLKVDRVFIAGLPGNADDVAITKAIITMAHSLGISVIAEGVETKAQRDFLVEQECDAMQGYFFARPMPASEMAPWLHGARHREGHARLEVVPLRPAVS